MKATVLNYYKFAIFIFSIVSKFMFLKLGNYLYLKNILFLILKLKSLNFQMNIIY